MKKFTIKSYNKEIKNNSFGKSKLKALEYNGIHTKALHKCLDCTHEFYTIPKTVRQYGVHCPNCNTLPNKPLTQKGYNVRIAELNKKNKTKIRCVGEFKNTKNKVRHECGVCSHTWLVVPRSILSGSGCPKCSKPTTPEYLTQGNLGTILHSVQKEIVFDTEVNIEGIPKWYKCDFLSEDLKLAIEFDGYGHYTNPKQIYNDSVKDAALHKNGYRVLRIPYFIQMNSALLQTIFGKKFDYKRSYPHGFVDSTCILPAQYCELGIIRFKEDLNRFPKQRKLIIKTLKRKIEQLGNINLVLPPSLHYLVLDN